MFICMRELKALIATAWITPWTTPRTSLYRPSDNFKEKTYIHAYVNILEHVFTVTFGRHLVIAIFLGPIP